MVESTADRKKRLAGMKSKAKGEEKEKSDSISSMEADGADSHAAKKMKFRNYLPYDASLGATDEKKDGGVSGGKGGEDEAKGEKSSKKKIATGVDLIKQELAAFDEAKESAAEMKVLPQKPDQYVCKYTAHSVVCV